MFKIKIPEFDYKKVAEFCDSHAELPNSMVASKVFGDARNTTCTEVTDTIGYYLQHEVSKASSQKLHFAYSFAWVYPTGAFVDPHIDRSQLEWYCGLTMEQDAPWCYQTQYGDKWYSANTGLGIGVVMDGSRYVHRRPVYKGKQAVSVVCSYVQNPDDIETIRKDLQFDHYDLAMYQKIAGKIGLNPEDFLGFSEKTKKPIDSVDLDISDEEMDGYCQAMRNEVYYRHSIDKSKPVLHGQIFTPLMGLHMKLKEWMKETLKHPFTTPQPTGIMYHAMEHDYVYETHPNDDYVIVIPLDKDSAESWKVQVGNSNLTYCPYGKGLLFAGYPCQVKNLFAGGNCFGNWAIMPFRQYTAANQDNLFAI